MENTNSLHNYEIDVADILWRLLSQWKMIIIVAILSSIIVAGTKYSMDKRDLAAAIKEQTTVDEDELLSSDERVEKILSAFSGDDRTVLKYLAKMQMQMREQEQYLSDSILLNSNPADQRTMNLNFFIKREEGTELLAVYDAYAAFVQGGSVAEALEDVIEPGAGSRYILELITIRPSYSTVIDSGISGMLLRVSIALPDGADAAAVESVFTGKINEYSAGLAQKIGPHSITLIDREEIKMYNMTAVDRKAAVTNSINNMQNNLKNYRSYISVEQKTALDAISAIQMSEMALSDVEPETLQQDAGEKLTEEAVNLKPARISKKYAVIGFMLGVIGYVFVYLMIVIFSCRLMSARFVEKITGGRLLGDIYYFQKHRGLDALLHSTLIDSVRFRGKDDPDAQSRLTVRRLQAVCSHAGINKLSLLCAATGYGHADKLIDKMVESLGAAGIETDLIALKDDCSDSELLNVQNAARIVFGKSRIQDIDQMTKLCAAYDIKQLGSIYVECV